jgi:transposase-like protein
MAPRKLSDADKRQITSIYCQPGETTSTLASKFGISSSTVSRVLKQVLPDEEYAKLMKWKRSGERGRFPLASSPVVEQLEAETHTSDPADHNQADATDQAASSVPDAPDEDVETAAEPDSTPEPIASAKPTKERPTKRSRRRGATAASGDTDAVPSDTVPSDAAPPVDESTEAESVNGAETATPKPIPAPRRVTAAPADVDEDEDHEVAAWVSEGLADSEDYDEESDEDWDEETWDDDDDTDEAESYSAPREAELTIHSFDSFSLTKPCYLVVDRMAELITCPLKDFSELGVIPPDEEQARTLPVFDNHRVARRFARRNQRIIKVPDALMLNKTQGYLEAKGITRILFEGEVYALSAN